MVGGGGGCHVAEQDFTGAWQWFSGADSIVLTLGASCCFHGPQHAAELHVAMRGGSQAVLICPTAVCSALRPLLLTRRRRPPVPCAARSRWSGGRKWRPLPPRRCKTRAIQARQRGHGSVIDGQLAMHIHWGHPRQAAGCPWSRGCWQEQCRNTSVTRGPPQVDHAGGRALGAVAGTVVQVKRVSLHRTWARGITVQTMACSPASR